MKTVPLQTQTIGETMNTQLINQIHDLLDSGTYSFHETPEYYKHQLTAAYLQGINGNEQWADFIKHRCAALLNFMILILETKLDGKSREWEEKLIHTLLQGTILHCATPIDNMFAILSQAKKDDYLDVYR